VESPRARPKGCLRGAWVVWVLVALLATGLLPAPAWASTASTSMDVKPPLTFGYVAAPGEANRAVIVQAPDVIRVFDSGATITAGPGWTSVSPHEVFCSEAEARVILTGDLDDFVTVAGLLGVSVDGGDGNDTLEGGDGPDFLRGGTGADTLKVGVRSCSTTSGSGWRFSRAELGMTSCSRVTGLS
jgi:RTX calcium-binding nonapeptide repeat (4 copies)